MNVKGKNKYVDFELEDCEIIEDVTEREFGNEKDADFSDHERVSKRISGTPF